MARVGQEITVHASEFLLAVAMLSELTLPQPRRVRVMDERAAIRHRKETLQVHEETPVYTAASVS